MTTLNEQMQEVNRAFRLLGETIAKEFTPTLLRLNEALQPIAEMERRRRLRRWLFAGVAMMVLLAAIVWVLS